jgi:hypothetical protein
MMQQQAALKLVPLHQVAERLYTQWVSGLKPAV